MKKVYLLTGNKGKIMAANAIFDKYNIEVAPLKLDIPEIQANTSTEIATAAALKAFEISGKPVIREDHSFYIDDLGMPGPFMAYIDKTIDNDQLLKILDTLPTRNGHFNLAATYVDEGGKAHEFNYDVPVVFETEARGDENMRWERLMRFPDDTRTFAEYPESERAERWAENFKKIAEIING